MALRSLTSQFAWVLPSRVVAALLQAGTFLLLARQAGPDDFGRLATVVAVTTVVATSSDFGLGPHISRLRSRDPTDRRLRTALRLNGTTSTVLAVGSTTALLVGGLWDPFLISLAPLGVWIGAERNITAWSTVSMADGTAHVNAAFLVARRSSTLFLFVLLTGVLSAPAAYALSAATCSVFTAYLWRRRLGPTVPAPGTGTWGETIRAAWPFWANTALTQLRQLDTAIVAALISPVAAGHYAVVTRLSTPLQLIPQSMAPLLIPHLQRNRRSPGRALAPVFAGLMAVMTVVLGAVALLAPLLVVGLAGPAYEPSVPLLQVLCVGLLFAGATSLITAALQGIHRERAAAGLAGVATTCLLAGVVVGAATHGAPGAVVGLSGAYATQCLAGAAVLLTALRHTHEEAASAPPEPSEPAQSA